METHNDGESSSLLWTRDSPLTKRFIRLFYGIMNTYPEHLHLFYGDSSRVIVSEFGPTSPPLTQSADTKNSIQHLLRTVYEGVRATVKTAIPQISVEEGVLLLVSGIFTRNATASNTEENHCFTQSLMLAPQKQGYYVLTDTLHIMNGGNAESTDTPYRWAEDAVATNANQSCSFYPVIRTCLPKSNTSRMNKQQNVDRSTDIEACEGPSEEIPPIVDATPKPSLQETQETEHEKANDEEEDNVEKINKGGKSTTTTVVSNAAIPNRKIHSVQQRVTPVSRANAHTSGSRLRGPTTPLRYSVGVPAPAQVMKRGHHHHQHGPLGVPMMNAPLTQAVFIARLPFGIQPEEVVKAFSIFGPIVNGADGIQVRDGRNGCYAFVTFESAASADAAIQNGAVLQGKRVFVEPRRMTTENADPGFIPMHVGMSSSCVLAPPPPPPPMHIHQMPSRDPCYRRRAN
eukprot:g7657.t1